MRNKLYTDELNVMTNKRSVFLQLFQKGFFNKLMYIDYLQTFTLINIILTLNSVANFINKF